MSTPSLSTDRSLLFGLLALQTGFVGRDALMDAMTAWLGRKDDPLAAVLVERGALAPHRARLIDALVSEHAAEHNGDALRGLALLPLGLEVLEGLLRLGDDEVRATATSLNTATGCWPQPPPSPPPPPLHPAAPRYRKLREHARGGLGEVHVAIDEELNREVALKEIQPQHADRPDFRARFLREALVTGSLEHPGVVPVYGLGANTDGRPYYAMRFVRGETLHDAIRRFHHEDKGGRSPGERELALRS